MKITAILLLVGLVVLPMVAAADSATVQPDSRMQPSGGPEMGCDQVQQLIAAGTLPPDTPAQNACESHGCGRRK